MANIFSFDKNGKKSFERGMEFYNKRDFKKALASFLKAEESGFREETLNIAIADCYLMLQDNINSIKYSNASIENNPNVISAYFTKGSALALMKEYKSALKSLHTYEDLMVSSSLPIETVTYIAIKNCYFQLGEYNNATKYAELLLKASGKNDLFSKAYAYHVLDKKKAAEYLLEHYKLNNNLSEVYLMLHSCYLSLEDYENVIKWADKAIEENIYVADAHYHKGVAYYYKDKEYTKALEHLLGAEKLGCSEQLLNFAITNCYLNLKDNVNTIKYANILIEKNKKDYYAYTIKAYSLFLMEKYKEALEISLEGEKYRTSEFPPNTLIIDCYTRLKDFKNAIKYADYAISNCSNETLLSNYEKLKEEALQKMNQG